MGEKFTLKFMVLALSAVAAVNLAGPADAHPRGGAGGNEQRARTSKAELQRLYREGVEALQAEDYRKAERRFCKVLDSAPNDPMVNYLMGLALMGRERTSRAIRSFEKAVELQPDFAEARLALGQAYMQDEEPDKARGQLEALEGLLAACDSGESDCGEERKTRLTTAVTRLRAAIEGTDTSAMPEASPFLTSGAEAGEGAYNAAVALINQGKFEEAIRALHKAHIASGPSADLFNYLGFAHRKLGRFEEARAWYGRALTIDPDHLGAHEYLGELYVQTGETGKAEVELAKLDALCAFGCIQREDLARAIEAHRSLQAAPL